MTNNEHNDLPGEAINFPIAVSSEARLTSVKMLREAREALTGEASLAYVKAAEIALTMARYEEERERDR